MSIIEGVYHFLMLFKQDSGFFINDFFRGLSEKQIINGQFNEFDYMTGDIDFDQYGKPGLYLYTIEELNKRKQNGQNYWNIDIYYMAELINFAEFMSEQESLKNEMVVYRGCNSLEIDGVDGLVSTTKDIGIAKQFNRGTILKIHLPKGMKIVDIDKVRPKKSGDKEQEVLLPPCNFIIRSEKIINLRGPNNHSGKTRMIEIDVQPKDLLREFAIRMVQPPDDYMQHLKKDRKMLLKYVKAKDLLYSEILNSTINIFGNLSHERKNNGTALYGRIGVFENKGFLNEKTERRNTTNFHKSFELLKSGKTLPVQTVEFMKQKGISIDDQVMPMDFYTFIRKSKCRRVFSDYENTDEHKEKYIHQEHGIRHADNTTMYVYYIASKEGYSFEAIRFLMEAMREHDIGRTNDWEMGNHGFRGAEIYKDENVYKMSLADISIVEFLILAHDLPSSKDVKKAAIHYLKEYLKEEQIDVLCDMAHILRDADALDRTRFPIFSEDYINCRFLTHESARQLVLVAQTLNYLEKEQDRNSSRANRKDVKIHNES